MQKIAILGATGSIGTQTLEVVKAHPDKLGVYLLSGHSNAALLIEQALAFDPKVVVVTDEKSHAEVKNALSSKGIQVLLGQTALNEAVCHEDIDMVVAAIVGYAGLSSTLSAIRAGKDIALANKETLVVAGPIVMEEAKKHGVKIIPVDSEHSAIFQCLVGENLDEVEKVILSASGGPFLGKKPNFLVNVKKDHALQHPNWEMGAKISIDSATLMNKGLEMIEAKWLFNLNNDQIEVIIHTQSIIHSFVQFIDGSIKAQMGLPDMRIPIQYALSYPNHWKNDFKRLNFKDYSKFNFEAPDIKTFRNLALAQAAMEQCGNMPCILNAANEIAVHGFLKNKVGFVEMTDIIEKTMEKIPHIASPSLDDLMKSNDEARKYAEELVKNSQLYN